MNAWKQRAEHAEHRLKDLEEEAEVPAASDAPRRTQQLEAEGRVYR